MFFSESCLSPIILMLTLSKYRCFKLKLISYEEMPPPIIDIQLSIFCETISSILDNWFTKSLMGFTFMQFDKSSIFKLLLLDIEPVFKDKISK